MARSIRPDPSDDEPEGHAERLFQMLRTWGGAEMVLDQCLLGIMRRHEDPNALPPYPATLERKLEYLKGAVARFPPLQAGADWAEKADRLLSSHKQMRNDIVHSNALKADADGTVYFAVMRRRKSSLPTFDLRVVGPKQWDQLWTASIHAMGYLMLFYGIVAPGDGGFYATNQITRERAVELTAGFPGSKKLRELVIELLAGAS